MDWLILPKYSISSVIAFFDDSYYLFHIMLFFTLSVSFFFKKHCKIEKNLNITINLMINYLLINMMLNTISEINYHHINKNNIHTLLIG